MNINGRIKVKTLKLEFKKEFGLSLRIYDGRSFADENSTLASIRQGDNKGAKFSPQKNTKVGNLEEKIMSIFGIKIQISGSYDDYLCDNDLTLAGALESDKKKILKKSKKVDNISNNTKNSRVDELIESGMPGKAMSTQEFKDFIKTIPEVSVSTHSMQNVIYTDKEMMEDMGEQDYCIGSSAVHIMTIANVNPDDKKTPSAIVLVENDVVSVLFGGEDEDFQEWMCETYYPLQCKDIQSKKIDWSMYGLEDLAMYMLIGARNYADGDQTKSECFDFLPEDDSQCISSSREWIRSFDSEEDSFDTGFVFFEIEEEVSITNKGLSCVNLESNNLTIKEISDEVYEEVFNRFFELGPGSDGFDDGDGYGAIALFLEKPLEEQSSSDDDDDDDDDDDWMD